MEKQELVLQMPFGKYKGQLLSEVISDKEYTDWLLTQTWLRGDLKVNLLAIINNSGGVKTDDTPEHNKLQAKFLENDNELSKKLISFLRDDKDIQKYFQLMYKNSDDIEIIKDYLLIKSNIKVKIEEPVGRYFSDLLVDFQSVYINFVYNHDSNIRDQKLCHFYKRILVELKPEISDDYPSILRKQKALIKENRRPTPLDRNPIKSKDDCTNYMVITEKYSGSVDFNLIKEQFKSADIHLMLLEDVEIQITRIGLDDKKYKKRIQDFKDEKLTFDELIW